ncbi:hypothetical protein Poli38472_001905 [Pythium oligandrum]|uniref:Ankyrin repeat protein n=1 Tax=Pythium oligandrum TaxID=41045 RepID=A0A8K1FQT0_PYTOL|nr:hypothetical protein Poli38472_001905 [Pythium oligandrum]|eukprot:TMW69749.1 hypothetical protein Poli38472_001905 [Pythium oligandrum]
MNGDTALHIAVLRSAAACVEFLLKRGADTGIMNANGETPLCLAASTYRAAMIPLLAEFGADIQAQNHAGSTPLAQCLRTMSWINELHPIYETAYELVVCGASKFQNCCWSH